jgi:intracellular sulfur oxidation DsrE/DsrF family protein
MNRSYPWFVLLTTLLCGFVSVPATQAEEPVKRRLLLQVSEESVDRMMVALNNALHVKQHYGPERVEVAVIAFSGGVQTLKHYAPIPLVNRLRKAQAQGVSILVCEQSLRAADLKPAQMLPDIEYVPAAVVEILERSSEGWVNVRP